MSVTVGTADIDVTNGLKLLSLDAGGVQAVSQLRILEHLMEKLSQENQGTSEGIVKRPCEIFDVIGGVGTGGLIAIFLVVFKMTAQEALEEFTKFAIEVYKDADQDAEKQTKRLKEILEGILEKHIFAKETKLIPVGEPTATCKLIVPVMYKNSTGVTCVLRNHVIRQEPPTNLTLAEAMLATSAAAPTFTPISIGKDFSAIEYSSGDLGFSNPIHGVITGAHLAFGDKATVACLLSVGCGHSGDSSLSGTSNSTARIDFFEQLAMDSEKVAQDISSQMSQFPIYYRFSVNYGPEVLRSRAWADPETATARTAVYLKGTAVTELLDRCVNSIKKGHGSTTLERLRHAGGAAIYPLPPRPKKRRGYTLELMEDQLGADHPDPISASVNQAIIYGESGRYAEAEELQLEVLRQRKQQLGPDDPKTIAASMNLAITYSQWGRYADAEALEQEVLKQRRKGLGNHHPDTLDASANLAATYGRLRRHAEAEELQLEVLTQRRQQQGIDHPDTIDAAASLAITYGRLERYAEAEELEVAVLRQRKQQAGPDDPKTITASANLAATYGHLRRYDEAKVLEQEVLRQRKQQLGINHPDTINASFNLAITSYSLRRYAEAKLLVMEVVRLRQSNLGVEHPDTLEAIEVLATIERESKPRWHERILAHLMWFFCFLVAIWAILTHEYTLA